jgi:REP element-mobilizing transposase RayT
MVQQAWADLSQHYPGVETDAVVVMPNHLHGVIVLLGGLGSSSVLPDPRVKAAPGLKLGDIVHRFKSLTTHRFADGVKGRGWPAFRGRLWQRNYFEHVIRDRGSLDRIREYIAANPAHWPSDSENPHREVAARATDFLEL